MFKNVKKCDLNKKRKNVYCIYGFCQSWFALGKTEHCCSRS